MSRIAPGSRPRGTLIIGGLCLGVLAGAISASRDLGEWLIPAAAVLVLPFSLWLMHEAVGLFNLQRITVAGAWYYTYLIMLYGPSFQVYLDQDDGPARELFLFSVASALITVPLGLLLANRLLGFGKDEIDRYFRAPLEDRNPGNALFAVLLITVLLTSSVALLYFLQIETIPLLYLFENPGDASTLTELREESFKLLDPRWASASSTPLFYAFLFLRTLVNPYLMVVLLGYWLSSRSTRWALLFVAGAGVSLFYAGASLARAPVAALFLRMLFFVYLFVGGRLSMKLIVPGLVAILFFPVMVTELAYGQELNLIDAIYRVWLRLTYTDAWGLYKYFEAFPASHDFLYGHTLIKPVLQFLALPYFYIENYVYLYSFPGTNIATGHMNAAFQSNLWADFGIVGVLVGGVAIGVILQGIFIHVVRQPKTVLYLAVYSFLVYAFYVLNFGSITSILIVNGALPVLFLPAAFKLAQRVLARPAQPVQAETASSLEAT